MKKKVGEFFRDEYPFLAIVSETPPRTDFNVARNHAITLLNIHDQKTGGGKVSVFRTMGPRLCRTIPPGSLTA